MPNLARLVQIAALTAALSPAASADVYHVSLKGDDSRGDGSFEKPWRHIQKACDECSAGDTVMIHPGTYRERVEINVSGSKEEGWVTVMGETGAVLSGENVPGNNLIHLEDQSFVRLLNLELRDNANKKESCGIMIEGAAGNLEIRKCKITNCRGRNAIGIAVYGTNAKTAISHLIIQGNEIADCEPAPSEALTLNGNVTDFQVLDNHIHDVNNIGIDFIGGEKDIVDEPGKVTRRGICRGNRVERARSSYGGGYGAGIYVDGGQEILLEKNRVTQCDLGIEVGAENPGVLAQKITVKDNVLYLNDKAGLAIGGYSKETGRVTDCEFIGNICYQNTMSKKAQAELWIQWTSHIVIKQNTFWVAAGSRMVATEGESSGNMLESNLWYADDGGAKVPFVWNGKNGSGFTQYQQLTGQEAKSVFRRPEFTDPTNGDFSLR